MTKPKQDDAYSAEEARRRFEAALRGSRLAGSSTMKETVIKNKKAKRKKTKSSSASSSST
jgi:hypothetical protein